MKKLSFIMGIVTLGVLLISFSFAKVLLTGKDQDFGRMGFKSGPMMFGSKPPFDQTGCREQFPDKFRFHQERDGKMEQVEKNTDRIIQFAQQQGYDITKLKRYQQQLIDYKQKHPLPAPCLTGSLISGVVPPLPPAGIREIVDNMQVEFEDIKDFLEEKRKSEHPSFWQRIVNFFRR